jgi:hypothetical protein
LKTPQTFPNIGKDSASVDYLIQETDVPYEIEEIMGLQVMCNLVQWQWGAQALLANKAATKYMLTRIPKSQQIVQKKFELVGKALEMTSRHAGIATAEIVGQLLEYQSAGVYGDNAKGQDAPMVEHETL